MKKEHWSTLSHLKERMELIKSSPGVINDKDIKLVYDFAKLVSSKEYLGGFINAVVLFGSVMRKESTKGSDIDVLVLVDDVSNEITSEMASAYSLSVGSLLVKLKAEDKIHLTTLGIIRFWDGVRNGDPVIMSILRSGKPIVDTGFFNPLKKLLERGMIKPTREAVTSYLRMAESLIRNQMNYYAKCIVDSYWAVMDSAHALIMHAGLETTHPRDTSRVFAIAAKRLGINPRINSVIDEFVKIMKSITKGGKRVFTGKEVDDYRSKANDFVNKVKSVID